MTTETDKILALDEPSVEAVGLVEKLIVRIVNAADLWGRARAVVMDYVVLDKQNLLGYIAKHQAALKEAREALRDISGDNDCDGNSMICEDDDACRDRARQALARLEGV